VDVGNGVHVAFSDVGDGKTASVGVQDALGAMFVAVYVEEDVNVGKGVLVGVFGNVGAIDAVNVMYGPN
jgi:hypothetical protein